MYASLIEQEYCGYKRLKSMKYVGRFLKCATIGQLPYIIKKCYNTHQYFRQRKRMKRNVMFRNKFCNAYF